MKAGCHSQAARREPKHATPSSWRTKGSTTKWIPSPVRGWKQPFSGDKRKKPQGGGNAMNEDRKPLRCAIYTRKSTEEGLEQESNALQAQRESAEAYIRSHQFSGWIALPDSFDDGGFSGASLERPAMERLLHAIEAGQIDCVVVYKVDRLSRSLFDFARLMSVFDRHGVSFVSVTQEFKYDDVAGPVDVEYSFVGSPRVL